MIRARIRDLTTAQRTSIFERGRAQPETVAAEVRVLIEDVRTRGDAALRAQAQRFDNVDDLTLEIPRAAWLQALDEMPDNLRVALELAARNIATFHSAQTSPPLEVEIAPGLTLGRWAQPLDCVGVYAPGGRAAYPSSVLMGVVPARVAGVREIIVCSPAPSAEVLAACAIANADRLFAIGGAGAIAALALGTQSVPRVDKIVGPGNVYVTEAKRQMVGYVAIDCPAGPSEVLVLADDSADAEIIAWELRAQAEHDPQASAVLVTTCAAHIDDVALLADDKATALLLADDVSEMLAFSALYAPEHLALYVPDARALLPRVVNAGTVFLGSDASVAFGDYLTGANHVLPTSGQARSFSGLSALDFVRWTTYQHVTAEAAAELAEPTAVMAEAEGLPAHAHAARLRGRVPV